MFSAVAHSSFMPSRRERDHGSLRAPIPGAEPDVTGGPVNAVTQHSRDKLAACVDDYNAMFGTNNSVKDGKAFYTYYKGLAKRMKSRDRKDFVPDQGIDILLVANMFLTGFDAKTVNTLYVDKNLRYHGLIQAFSRTNRILGQLKSQGNIVVFRNLKERVDQAIALFSNKDAKEKVLVETYQVYVDRFNEAVRALQEVVKTPADVDRLESEEDVLAFVQAFRELIRIRNVLQTFAEFDPGDLHLPPQRFEDFKSKYLDIYDRAQTNEDDDAKASIIDEVDFELELIRRDNINVAYILALLASIAAAQGGDADAAEDAGAKKKAILDVLGAEPRLRSKRELIEEFINAYLPTLRAEDETWAAFRKFWDGKRTEAFDAICVEEGLAPEAFSELMAAYQFTGAEPLTDEVISAINEPPGILQRKKVASRIVERMVDYIETFDEHLGDIDAV